MEIPTDQPRVCRLGGGVAPVLEEFMNLQVLLAQSLGFWFGFKMLCGQFSTVQFPSHQFVWKVRSVQFGARGLSASVKFVQFSAFNSVHELFRS